MTYRSIHNDFRLNGFHYSLEELKEVAYSLVKEGEIFEKSIGDFLLDWLSEKPTVVVQTSGSTGRPKKIELQKQHMVNSAMATGAFFGLTPGSSALLCLPTDFIAGKMMLVRAIVLGLQLDYVKPFSNPLQQIFKSYDFCAMVPLQLENSIAKLSQIRTLIVGGAAVSHKVQEQVQEHAQNTEVFETYGMTETVTHIALKRIVPIKSESQKFKTLSKVSVSTDDRNCLVINAPEISDSIITTNDVVKLISDSEFEWLGRYDNVINSGGVKLFPEQIEKKLVPLIKQRFFVTGFLDEKLGQKLVLVVEGDVNPKKFLHRIKSKKSLNTYEVPKEVHVVETFQETANGKILRGKTLEQILLKT